jgi:hypothetical protein
MRKAAVFVAFVISSFSAAVFADQVTFKNGDRLTGTIVNSNGKEITFKTDGAGEIKIQWDAVKELTSDETVYLVTAEKKTVSGKVTTEERNLLVHTANGGAVAVPFASVATIRSESEQAAYEKSLHPGLLQDWKGGANIGFAFARGNSDTTNLDIAFNADRKTSSDEITLFTSTLYSTNGGPGGGVTADAILGGARYARNITPRLFAFASADYTHDELQALNLRSIYTAGLGWHLVNNPNTTFDVLAGANYTRETYSGGATTAGSTTGVNRNLPGITAGEDFTRKFGAASVFTEHFYFYPDLDDLSQYRFALDAGWVTKINRWLGWQVSVSDRYHKNPPILGPKKNDVIFSTGLNIAFSR